MASFKSTINKVNKTELYFNKYSYKASITTEGVYWIRSCKNIDKFIKHVNDRYDEYETYKDRYPHGWYRMPLSLHEHDLDLIEYLIDIKNSLEGTDVRFRHEHETFSLYTNDDSLIKSFIKQDRWVIEKAEVSPQGVKYFKKDPPAKFRAYMSGNKTNAEFCQEMLEYLNRTPDLEPSNAFYDWLSRRTSYNHAYVWLWNNHFIDYNDERNLMMLHLMFPGVVGKTYKLEKKP